MPQETAEKISRMTRTPLASGEERRMSDTKSLSAPPAGADGAPWPWNNARTVKADDNEPSNTCRCAAGTARRGQPNTQAKPCQTYDTMAVLAQITTQLSQAKGVRP